ncbi:MAG: SprB repeat-containing protein [Flavobacteriales bacterium]|nr:SprB repeat-containing protein [Flavobacteriales bacterium]
MSAQVLSVQLDPSDHNGFTISCFGGKDGSIDLTVSGGTPPYTYEWSTGANTQDIFGVAAGYYRVAVYDSDTGYVVREITLSEPELLVGTATAFEYPNDFNVSCHSCYNGSIDAGAIGGVAPYSYEWRDGSTVEDRSGLGARDYTVVVRDANGCEAAGITLILREPQRNDWTMNGNAGTIPGPHYFGTSDNQDVVFKSNGIERLRLLGTGQVKLSGLGDGILKSSGGGLVEVFPFSESLMPHDVYPFWRTDGNYLVTSIGTPAFLGTRDNSSLWIKTNNLLRMIISDDGRAALGEEIDQLPMAGALTIKTGWNDWLTLRRRTSDPNDDGFWHLHNPGPDFSRLIFYYTDQHGDSPEASSLTLWNDGNVSIGDNQPSSLDMRVRVGGGLHASKLTVGDVGDPSSLLNVGDDFAVLSDGRVRIGDDVTTPDNGYRLYVQGGLLTEKVKVAIRSTTQWSDHIFKADYCLPDLDEVASYIEKYGHLPGVPSASSMVDNGLDVVQTDAILLAKIEELTLYIIQLEKRISELE